MQKSSIQLLAILLKNNCTSTYRSFTISKILPLTTYKYTKIYNDLSNLLSGEYINRGIKSERSNTYFITEKGMSFIRGLNNEK